MQRAHRRGGRAELHALVSPAQLFSLFLLLLWFYMTETKDHYKTKVSVVGFIKGNSAYVLRM